MKIWYELICALRVGASWDPGCVWGPKVLGGQTGFWILRFLCFLA